MVNEESKEQEDLYELTEEDLKECEIFVEPEEILSNHNFSSFMFEEYVESFYTKIHTFIQKYIPSKFHLTYIKRIDRIKQMLKQICKKKKTNRNILGKLIDNDCITFNNCLFKKYKLHLELTEKVFQAFSSDLDRAIDGFFDNKFKEYETLDLNDLTERPFLLIQEYLEIYKYITIVPEILALGYVLVINPSIKTIIIVRLLRLFITNNKESINENRIFILLFIFKALSCTSKNQLDFIRVANLQELIISEHPDLNFFILEFKFTQRVLLQKRIEYNKNQSICLRNDDHLYCKHISRIFIFQHVIFLKFNDAEYKQYEELKLFYDTTMNFYGCYGCQFNNFIYLVQSQF